MNFIILTRNPNGRGVLAIMGEDDSIMQFETREAAEKAASNQVLCKAWGYQIVELEV